MSRKEFSGMDVKALREICRAGGIKSKGTKEQLLSRLRARRQQQDKKSREAKESKQAVEEKDKKSKEVRESEQQQDKKSKSAKHTRAANDTKAEQEAAKPAKKAKTSVQSVEELSADQKYEDVVCYKWVNRQIFHNSKDEAGMNRGIVLGSIAEVSEAVKHGNMSEFITAFEYALHAHGPAFRLPNDIMVNLAMHGNSKDMFDAHGRFHESELVKIARCIISKGSRKWLMNYRDPISLRSPLFYSLTRGTFALSQFLIMAKADLHCQDAKGETALFAAAASRSAATCVETLLEYGAQPQHLNHKGRMALYVACEACQHENVQALLQYMFPEEINHKDLRGQTALFTATDGFISTLLLREKANPDIQDRQGRTALFYAAHLGHEEQARALLEGGADADVVDKREQTALFYATRSNNLAICKMLVHIGYADIWHTDGNDVTFFDYLANVKHKLSDELCAFLESLLVSAQLKNAETDEEKEAKFLEEEEEEHRAKLERKAEKRRRAASDAAFILEEDEEEISVTIPTPNF
mmetsp:Transcript_105850/g.184071  ORF Transcript_105850/g.184071 Transcript_105850/m.184071 type:complete len:527 (-) Transcript_105850:237-1817(-)